MQTREYIYLPPYADDFPTCLRNSNLNVECRKTRRQNYSKAAMPIFLIGFSTSINLRNCLYLVRFYSKESYNGRTQFTRFFFHFIVSTIYAK